jgi:hypothetical protein
MVTRAIQHRKETERKHLARARKRQAQRGDAETRAKQEATRVRAPTSGAGMC